MSCPFNEKSSLPIDGKLSYSDYLMLDKILNSQRMLSDDKKDKNGENPAYDEHLFIIIHQTYELWFKEILYELDLVRDEFSKEKLNFSEVIKRLHRIVIILKLLVDQVLILETMTPMDFNDFRQHLDTASGFQSMQFRLIENKLGMRNENRSVKFNQNYCKVFRKDENALDEIQKSLSTPSLLQLIDKWLAKTPHLDVIWKHYKEIVEINVLGLKQPSEKNSVKVEEKVVDEIVENVDELNNLPKDDTDDTSLKKLREQFESVFDSNVHDALVKRGERRLSFAALHAAIVINLYKDDAIFAASHQILTLLVDIDGMLSRWRYNHVLLVQRMIGSMQVGTGGSSGYQYLRSTLSDRYKPFVDLSNLATFLINKSDLLPLNQIILSKQLMREGQKKGRKSSRRQEKMNNCRHSFENGVKQRCLHFTNSNNANNGSNVNNSINLKKNCESIKSKKSSQKKSEVNCIKICNVCIETKQNIEEIRGDFHDFEEEKNRKELESSYESTSSSTSSSTLNN